VNIHLAPKVSAGAHQLHNAQDRHDFAEFGDSRPHIESVARMNQEGLLATDAGLYTVSDLAAFFHCDPETVKRRARGGRFPGFKFGKTWLFRGRDINAMIDGEIDATRGEQE
jgi:hypothetical protein